MKKNVDVLSFSLSPLQSPINTTNNAITTLLNILWTFEWLWSQKSEKLANHAEWYWDICRLQSKIAMQIYASSNVCEKIFIGGPKALDGDDAWMRDKTEGNDDSVTGTICNMGIFIHHPTCRSLFHITQGTFHHVEVFSWYNFALAAAFKLSTFNLIILTVLYGVVS